jgi:hypothetical protein
MRPASTLVGYFTTLSNIVGGLGIFAFMLALLQLPWALEDDTKV